MLDDGLNPPPPLQGPDLLPAAQLGPMGAEQSLSLFSGQDTESICLFIIGSHHIHPQCFSSCETDDAGVRCC